MEYPTITRALPPLPFSRQQVAPHLVFAVIPTPSSHQSDVEELQVVKGKIKRLGGFLTDSEKWDDKTTHVICLSKDKRVKDDERMKAAVSAGLWVVTKEYVHHSFHNHHWLSNLKDFAWSPLIKGRRKEVFNNNVKGALFWRTKAVLLMKEEATREAYKRIIHAGKGSTVPRFKRLEDLKNNPPLYKEVTHVILGPGRLPPKFLTSLKCYLASLEDKIECLDVLQLDKYIYGDDLAGCIGAPSSSSLARFHGIPGNRGGWPHSKSPAMGTPIVTLDEEVEDEGVLLEKEVVSILEEDDDEVLFEKEVLRPIPSRRSREETDIVINLD